MKSRIVSIGFVLAALALTRQALATVTAQAWYHLGEGGVAIQNDATTNGNTFNAVYYQNGIQPLVGPNAVGGPLGVSGYTSTNSARFGYQGAIAELFRSGTLNSATTNYYVPPATNYGIEVWFQPQNKGYVTDGSQSPFTPIFAAGGSIFGAGPGGGVALILMDNLDGTSGIQAAIVHQGDSAGAYAYFGPNIIADTNHWIHLALVNDNGTLTFYTNGVPCATNDNSVIPLTAPAGSLFIGRDGGHISIDGYLDEARVFTFAPGAFSINDLLFNSNPRVIAQPNNTTVWDGGAANFMASISPDPLNTFQWYQGTNILSGQTSAGLNVDTVVLTNSGNTYDCAITNGGNGLLTSNAVLTVVPVQTNNVNVYRNAVTSEAGLIAYFPGDGSSGNTLANTVDGTHNGTLQSGAVYDGQTNRAFGQRAVYLQSSGNVQIPSNTSYEFGSGNGTLEALIYLTGSAAGQNGTIFSVATANGSGIHYAFGASGDGNTLTYTNDAGVTLSWAAPVNLLNRFAHVALVFGGTTSVTAYLDGQSLGTKSQSGFGAAVGVPAWIGGAGSSALWNGTIDEVAIYSSSLSAATIAIHNSDFIFGTNTAPPSITSQSPSKTVYAGGSPVLSVVAGGTPPLSYRWMSNGIPISGATNASLAFPQVTPNASASYTVVIVNPFGSTNDNGNPINLTVVSPPAGYASVIMGDNPSAYWPMNEASGPTMKDYAGFNNGAYNGSGVTYHAGGPSGDLSSGVRFDGTTGVSIVPYSPVLNPSGPFTIEFWAQLSVSGFYSPISSMVRPARSAGYEFYVAGNFSGYEFHTASGGAYNMITGSGTAPNVGTWYHVAGVWDGSEIALYIDGYLIGTSTNPPFVANSSTPFYVGSRSDGTRYFAGSMSDVAFYNYALTPTQLQNHVLGGQPLVLTISPSSTVVADSKPSGLPFNGFNAGAVWAASDSDGTTTRNGVMESTATNNADQVYIPPYSDLITTNGTIMFWMRSTGTVTSVGNEGATLLQWRNNNGGCAFIQDDSGVIHVQAMNNWDHFLSTATVSDGKWHHVAFAYDQGSAGGISCYIDGALDSQGFNTTAWFWTPTATIELGQDFNDGGYWRNFQGSMDDVRMYNRILTQSEIQSAMTGSVGVLDTASLKLRLDFAAPPGGLAVSWPYGSVQTASQVNGAYTTFTNVISPLPVAAGAASQSFYRGIR
jgi:hypothetical protein